MSKNKLPDKLFLYHLRVCKQRSSSSVGFVARVAKRIKENPDYFKKKAPEHICDFDLTVPQLRKLWIKQKGICPHTGTQLVLPRNSKGNFSGVPIHKRSSLDRIDGKGNYTISNVHFVSLMSNYAKNRFEEKDIKLFVDEIKNNAIKEFLFNVQITHGLSANNG